MRITDCVYNVNELFAVEIIRTCFKTRITLSHLARNVESIYLEDFFVIVNIENINNSKQQGAHKLST